MRLRYLAPTATGRIAPGEGGGGDGGGDGDLQQCELYLIESQSG